MIVVIRIFRFLIELIVFFRVIRFIKFIEISFIWIRRASLFFI